MKMKKQSRQKRRKISKSTQNAIFVFIIAFSAFIAFEPLFKHLGQKAGQEFAAAIFGTIFAAVITMVLLNKQTETEQEKDRNDKVFEQKILIYNQVIDTLNSIFERTIDGTQGVNRRDILNIEFLLTKMIMVGSDKTIAEFKRLYKVLTSNYSSHHKYTKLGARERHIMLRFADLCREELGLSHTNMEREVVEDIVIHGELVDGGMKRAELGGEQSIELLKRIYGYLLFDLNLDSLNVPLFSNGFDAYVGEQREVRFIHCTIKNGRFYIVLNIDYSGELLLTEIYNGESALVIEPSSMFGDRLRYETLLKLINDSFNDSRVQLDASTKEQAQA